METADYFSGNNQSNAFQTTETSASLDHANTRLDALLRLNAETASEKSLYRYEQEEFEASLMRLPMSPAKAYGIFGAMLGTFPPAAIFAQIFERPLGNGDAGLIALCVFMNLVCASVGYGMGKVTGKMMIELEKGSISKMIFLAPLVGSLWALVTGFSGAAIFFVIGGFFGAMIALPVGLAAFPVFAIFHRLMKRGAKIELKHLLPIAFGITAVIAALILGS